MNVNIDVGGGLSGQLPTKFDPGKMRPWVSQDGGTYLTVFGGGDPTNAESWKNVQALGVNGTLRRDEWKQLDDAVKGIAESRLGGIRDLRELDLVLNLNNAMATTVFEWHTVSDAGEAVVTMDGVTRSRNDAPRFETNYLPLPVIHMDYEINFRHLEASRLRGQGIDTIMAERGTRRITEELEKMLFADQTFSFGAKDDRNRNSIYSYVNHPDRMSLDLSGYGYWDSGASANVILDSVLGMKQLAIDSHFHGPFYLYVPKNYHGVLDEDYDATSPGITIRERILKVDGIAAIRESDTLADDNVLLVQMTADNVRLIQGMGIQNVQWNEEGNFLQKFKIMTIQVPQLRSDINGKLGVVHAA